MKTMETADRWAQLDAQRHPVEEKPPHHHPPHPHYEEHFCPYCHQMVDDPVPGVSIPAMLGGGGKQLLGSLLMIGFAIVRCVRFVAAGALCLVGFIGSCCRALGLQIAHADDRTMLKKL